MIVKLVAMGSRQLAYAGLAIAILASVATADDTPIPDGFERIEVNDLTFTMRDDNFNTITTDETDPRIAYVGTHQGRFYKTTDRGKTWTESTIIPQQKRLWSVPGSTIFFGGIRDAGPGYIPGVASADLIGLGIDRSGPLVFSQMPSQLITGLPLTRADNALVEESQISAGSAGGSLGVGLSARSPRLSLLSASRGRPVPTLNRVRFLLTSSLRGTTITNIAIDPTDRRRLFAATVNGLYRSDDGGDSWSRTFSGLTAAERGALRVAFRPGTPSLMVLGTTNGVFTSTDRGDNWTKNIQVGGAVQDIAFDTTDNQYIYLATNGSVQRSTDGGATFVQVYFSTFPADANVRTIVVDPFDSETVYIGTMRGIYVTHNARAAQVKWEPLEGMQSVLGVPLLRACSLHKGHLYAMTRLDLHTINYGGAPPESAIIESWDGGIRWRQLFMGQSNGVSETFAIDAKDPDQLWIAWSTAMHRIERAASDEAPTYKRRDRDQMGPPLGELIKGALRYHSLELEEYTEKLDRRRSRSLLPRRLTVTAAMGQWSVGGIQDDVQFAADRYFHIFDETQWQVMAWASWSLPDLIYSADAVPLLRSRVNVLNDELRLRIMETLRGSYGELQRLHALIAVSELDVKTAVLYRLRIEQLEAVVDLTSGGYLTRWQKKHRRNAK